MTTAAGGPAPEPVDRDERERLAYTLTQRFGPHLEAGASAVREAEQALAEARERLARAREAESGQEYRSDRLVFMRAAVADEVEGLGRKTTPKKVRAAYRYLVDRAVELAAGEVEGYASEQADARRAREDGVAACEAAERQAEQRLVAARAMQERVVAAEQAARDGLQVMVDKLAAPDA